jgi:hypothetical protein
VQQHRLSDKQVITAVSEICECLCPQIHQHGTTRTPAAARAKTTIEAQLYCSI